MYNKICTFLLGLFVLGSLKSTPQRVEFHKEAIRSGSYKAQVRKGKTDKQKLKFYQRLVIQKDPQLTPREETELKQFIEEGTSQTEVPVRVDLELLKDLEIFSAHTIEKLHDFFNTYARLISDFDPNKKLSSIQAQKLMSAEQFFNELKELNENIKKALEVELQNNDKGFKLSDGIKSNLKLLDEKNKALYERLKKDADKALTESEVAALVDQMSLLSQILKSGVLDVDAKNMVDDLATLKKQQAGKIVDKLLQEKLRKAEEEIARLKALKTGEVFEEEEIKEDKQASEKIKEPGKKAEAKQKEKVPEKPKLGVVLDGIDKVVRAIENNNTLEKHSFPVPELKGFFYVSSGKFTLDVQKVYEAEIENRQRKNAVDQLVKALITHLKDTKVYASDDPAGELQNKDDLLRSYVYYTLAKIKKYKDYVTVEEQDSEQGVIAQEITEAKTLQDLYDLLLSWFVDSNSRSDLLLQFKDERPLWQEKVSVLKLFNPAHPGSKEIPGKVSKILFTSRILPGVTVEKGDIVEKAIDHMYRLLQEAITSALKAKEYDLEKDYFSKNKEASLSRVLKDLEKIIDTQYKNQAQLKQDVQLIVDALGKDENNNFDDTALKKLDGRAYYASVKRILDAAKKELKEQEKTSGIRKIFATEIIEPLREGKIDSRRGLLIKLAPLVKKDKVLLGFAKSLCQFGRGKIHTEFKKLATENDYQDIEDELNFSIESLDFYDFIIGKVKDKKTRNDFIKDIRSEIQAIVSYLKAVTSNKKIDNKEQRLHRQQRDLFKFILEMIDLETAGSGGINIREGMIALLAGFTHIFAHVALLENDYAFLRGNKEVDALLAHQDRITQGKESASMSSEESDDDDDDDIPAPPDDDDDDDDIPAPPDDDDDDDDIPAPPDSEKKAHIKKTIVPLGQNEFDTMKKAYFSFLNESKDYLKALKEIFGNKFGPLDRLYEFGLYAQKLEVRLIFDSLATLATTIRDAAKDAIGKEEKRKDPKKIKSLFKAMDKAKKMLKDFISFGENGVIDLQKTEKPNESYSLKIRYNESEYDKQLENYKQFIENDNNELGKELASFASDVRDGIRAKLRDLSVDFQLMKKNVFACKAPLKAGYVCKRLNEIYAQYGKRTKSTKKTKKIKKKKADTKQDDGQKKSGSKAGKKKKTEEEVLFSLAFVKDIKLKKIKELVNSSGDPARLVASQDARGQNALHMIANKAKDKQVDDAIAFLIDKNKAIVNVQDNDGNTPLHIAADSSNERAVGALVDGGADRAATNNVRKVALHMAIGGLLNINALKKLMSKEIIDAQDLQGNTPLHYAVSVADQRETYASKVIALLLQEGAQKDLKNNNRNTPADLTSKVEIKKLFQ